MKASQGKPIRNRMMLTYKQLNDQLNEMAQLNIVEPIDDPFYHVDFLDYADVVGIDIDDYVPPEYDHV
jgi:hypothetical protein